MTAIYVCCGAIVLTWLLSVLTREYSWVDRIWSLLPPVYAWIFAAEADFAPRSLLMAGLASAWGLRLSYNFWRKGGYAPGGEDYRWAILRQKLPGWAWAPFNLGFISGYQNLLILAFTWPAAVVRGASAPLGPLDLALALAFLGALVGETVADQQQWGFHQRKKAGQAEGFCTEGLFAWSRHPNFFFEQLQWWIFAAFSLSAGLGFTWNAWAGALLLSLLFDGSTRFTESISRGRHPAYAAYQAKTSRIIPWFPS